MTRFTSTLIGTGFGLAFVLANTGPPLSPTVALALRVVAVAAVVAVLALVVAIGRRPAADPGPDGPRMRFDAFFGAVLAVEAVALFGGILALRALDAPMQANVAWIALVVGLHFFPLARRWRARSLVFTAVYMSVLGLAGLAMVFAGYPGWAPLVSGAVTGAGMLTGILASLAADLRAAKAVDA
ncbi:hypothetical protein [Nocardiopsis tropica]|uniref:Uncharacterized protein n=1 Tax=Nocardiopsis tropica TaxID=109330 RepID=A0ABV1ZMX2_9ACTN|nr:hypothetical protein [Nocardiopsis tropica]